MMHTYRIYSVTERDVITGAVDRQFCSDADAVAQARGYLALHPVVEVWRIDQLIDRLERTP